MQWEILGRSGLGLSSLEVIGFKPCFRMIGVIVLVNVTNAVPFSPFDTHIRRGNFLVSILLKVVEIIIYTLWVGHTTSAFIALFYSLPYLCTGPLTIRSVINALENYNNSTA